MWKKESPPLVAFTLWRKGILVFLDRRVVAMLFFGFSAGLPILLIFSSLSLWLGEAGVERQAVTFFSWAALGYAFKFIWAPLVDQLPIPFLTRFFGRRRAWILMSQLFVIFAILLMSSVDPASNPQSLTLMAAGAVLLGFSSATQDIVIDAFRIESAPISLQALMSSAYIAGYRVGMVVAGAGALFLADYFGSTKASYNYGAWQLTYTLMAATMLIGLVTTLLVVEPQVSIQVPVKSFGSALSGVENARLLLVFGFGVSAFIGVFFGFGLAAELMQSYLGGGPMAALLAQSLKLLLGLSAAVAVGALLVRLGVASVDLARRTWWGPVSEFFGRFGAKTAWLVLALIGLYRISDIVLGVISNVFYQDLGFSKPEIAAAVKTFGVLVGIGGSILGGVIAVRIGVMRTLMLGAAASAITNLGFLVLAIVGRDMVWLYAVVSADNLAAGFASAAFVAFLSGLTNVSFTAVQYAIFSSLMTLLPKTLGGYSGGMVDALGYPTFFVVTTLIGLPVLWLIYLANQRLEMQRS